MLKLTHSTLIVAMVLALLIFGPRPGSAASAERLVVVGGALTEIVYARTSRSMRTP